MITPNDFKKGQVIEYDNKLLEIVDFQHVKPGKGPAFVKTELRNLRTGTVTERTFSNTSEKIQDVRVERRKMKFLYQDGDLYYFMDINDYEQQQVPEEVLGDKARFVAPDVVCEIAVHEGEFIKVELPDKVDLTIEDTTPGVKGDTASGSAWKSAVLETGAEVQVPLFIEQGDKIRINTGTGEYIERVSE